MVGMLASAAPSASLSDHLHPPFPDEVLVMDGTGSFYNSRTMFEKLHEHSRVTLMPYAAHALRSSTRGSCASKRTLCCFTSASRWDQAPAVQPAEVHLLMSYS